jgi:hypothetical protein
MYVRTIYYVQLVLLLKYTACHLTRLLSFSKTTQFAAHWLFWQDVIGLFNEENPSGGVTTNDFYSRVLGIGLVIGLIVAVKRTWIGFFFGRKTYVNYAEELSVIIRKIILLSKLGGLAKEIETNRVMASRRDVSRPAGRRSVAHDRLLPFLLEESDSVNDLTDEGETIASSEFQSPYVIDPERKDQLTGQLTDSQRAKVTKLLGAWEEPEKAMGVEVRKK